MSKCNVPSHDLNQRLSKLRHGDHLCMVYEDHTELMATATSVIKHGLLSGDRCAYIGEDETIEELVAALTDVGVDVEREQARQSLLTLTKRDTYLRSGRFDPHEMIEFLRQTEKQALADGFSGLRIAGDTTWALGPEEGCDRLIEYESLLNRFCPGSRIVGVCQYARQRFTPEIIGDTLRTHPVAILNDRVCRNFYYEPPELFNDGGDLQVTSERVEWMVSQLKLAEREDAERSRLEDELRTANRRRDEFLAMLAHELRNPLVPIRSGLDVLAIDAGDQRETIGVMLEQVEQVVRLVDDLVDLSRLMHGKFELQRETVELTSLIKRCVASVRPLIDTQKQELAVSVPEDPIHLNADPIRLVQMIENVLNNASEHTDRGCGCIYLDVERQNGQVVISVQDTGIGIEAEFLPSVFEPFTQSARSLDRAAGGLGIGLTLVRQIVELHGGTVSAHSEGSGHGSTFIVRLPLAATLTGDAVEESPNVQHRRILVVDDNEGAAWMLSKLLQKLGDHEVEITHDGPSALEKIRELHPEIVLLDIGLPGMNGWEVGKAIRKNDAFENVLLVALTGYGQQEDRRKSKEVGFDEHLAKPASVDQIKAVLAHPKLNEMTQ